KASTSRRDPRKRVTPNSGGKAAAASATLHRVRVVEREAPLVDAFVEVDSGAVEVQQALLVDGDPHAVLLDDVVLGVVGLVVEAEAVLKAAASAAGDTDAENGMLRHLLLGDDSLDFACR